MAVIVWSHGERRVVRLVTERGRTLEISCDPQGSVMLSYLYSLRTTPGDLSAIPVVGGYPDVFKEVRSLPPKREIDFYIYLVDNAKPVALPLRYMAPRERRKLSRQSAELQEKGLSDAAFQSGEHRLSFP